jgi:hypothetical protein
VSAALATLCAVAGAGGDPPFPPPPPPPRRHSDESPNVISCDGVYKHNTRDNTLSWRIESVGKDNSSGTLEFTIKGRSPDAFFPVSVAFTSADTLCPITVTNVLPVDEPEDGRPLRFAYTKGMRSDGYTVDAQ